jgi:pimeloyl-ACP methyl ester carboxylesterase
VIEPDRAAADLRPDTDSDTEALRSALRRIALPQRALDKPMLVANGDDDDVVLAEWVASAVAESCALGGQIQHLRVPDAGHDGMPEADGAIHGWIADRFAGREAGSDC